MVDPSNISQKLKTLTGIGSCLITLPILIFSDVFLTSYTVEVRDHPSTLFSVKSNCWDISCQVCSPKELQRIAQKITVKILSGSAWGSGILVKKQGNIYTVLTNQHILTPSDPPYSIQTPDGKIYSSYPISNGKFWGQDLALLQFKSQTQIYAIANLQLSPAIQPGDKVFGAGFPWLEVSNDLNAIEIKNHTQISKTQSELSLLSKPLPSKFSQLNEPGFLPKLGLHLTRGRVSLISEKAIQQGYTIGYTNPIQKGMSGGPLLNSQGKVIGINGMHAYPLWGDPYIYQDGSLPSPQLREKMVQLAFAIPMEQVIASIPELNQSSVLVELFLSPSLLDQHFSVLIHPLNYPNFDNLKVNLTCNSF
ncbi:serine protease [Planktothrix sp. FACHB-1365]|uniref:S1 family peptidase n=1 Tax=Planktothrix sp. FACHB-1365 TaxID=2692855 RepID=UPI001682A6C7|nr:serine protease [Planktothrix sp. FACHB-1365]MBD2480732.1 trypsin-like peptidase domain-containing protein [Planktothrix sp. FACHB-1365]